tara:strand:+ start:394 stop:591 length:198 start_codon:yes stop_codon:yes gene_type:complete
MTAGLIIFALTASPSEWDKIAAAPWSYQTPTKTSGLKQTTHCYKWLPIETKQIQKVSKDKNKKKK